ncbi:MAG: Pls/PosA family non-ribosomal peptide synthetase [Pseudomonadota bacterium]
MESLLRDPVDVDRHPSILRQADHDNDIRWRPGQTLYDLFEARCRLAEANGESGHPAIEADGNAMSYRELKRAVAAYADALSGLAIGSKDRVGLLLDRSINSYCVMLAVVRLGAVYVPLDVKFPAERIRYIADDAELSVFIAFDDAQDLLADIGLPTLSVSAIAQSAQQVRSPVSSNSALDAAKNLSVDNHNDRLAYIIYTSGSTGRPKGVAVNQSSICNFVSVAAEVYGYSPDDRVYQGLTFAFDFSVEEFWVPLVAGATLVASPSNVQLVGRALEEFLNDHRVTALCCVPTLLATIENDVPSLRFLLVSGEACPQDLVARWQSNRRRVLNAYGPTEATVTATWTELQPGRKVTIGVPLPTYSIAIVETDRPELVEGGQTGEIAIGGIGLAVGYVNRQDLTNDKFVPDFIGLPDNPSGRIYRTGDLGRINPEGEIEYFGRIDTQVKLKGYRIELSEIEEVLLQIDGVAQAVVAVCQSNGNTKELVAYFTRFDGDAGPSREDIAELLRHQLPSYMVPAFLEPLESIPLLPSQKADRKALPGPQFPRVISSGSAYAEPKTVAEKRVASCLAEILKIEKFSIDDHFFDHLGLDSLNAAAFVSGLTSAWPECNVSIADIYLTPTVRHLTEKLEVASSEVRSGLRASPTLVASTASHALCGALQAATYLLLTAGYLWIALAGFIWIAEAEAWLDVTSRSALFVTGIFGILFAVPIAAKWLLIGRWRAGQVPLWSLSYFRFWLVRLLVETSPLAAMRGSPVFNAYLRLLGARIGDNALLLCKAFPLCTDLISVGSNTVVRKYTHLTGYRAEGGYMRFGNIDVGADATVGAGAVVDLNTKIGNNAQLGHASALVEGQSIPDNGRAHGSPSVSTATDFSHVQEHAPSRLQRQLFGLFQIVSSVAVTTIAVAIVVLILKTVFGIESKAIVGSSVSVSLEGIVVLGQLSLIGFLFLLTAALGVHLAVPRLASIALRPGSCYGLYGVRYYLAQVMASFANVRAFHILFGDSSFVVHYLRLLGIRQPQVQQTGSNFGTSLIQDYPSACEVGSGTMVSDDLVFLNYEYSCVSFRVAETKLGQQLFLGNNIYFPSSESIGDNCLLASKVMLPIDAQRRSDIGLLGSPAFEIPRRNSNDVAFNPVPQDAEGYARLLSKNFYNLRTMGIYLFCNWLAVFMGFLAGYILLSIFDQVSTLSLVASGLALFFGAAPIYIISERLSLSGNRLKPYECTIHDSYFWWIERHWKLAETPFKYIFRGTPFRPWMHRFLGIEMGKRVFDDGAFATEKTLTVIEDDVCLNAEVSIQAHSLEDGLFKSDRIVIGAGSSVGPLAYIHYGAILGRNTEIAPDSFVMKGTNTKSHSIWCGNPARVVNG